MTQAFLEPIVLKPENEKFIVTAFSKENLQKISDFEKTKRIKLRRTTNIKKLRISDLV
jgi:hypothetical protein